jgi:WD and tetratricopeptide repeat-containing protein 1
LKLSNSIDTGHSANIFCTKFLPETGDDVVVSGAADAEVRVHRVTRSTVSSARASFSEQCAVFRCHTRRVKKLAVEAGNPHVIWSASEDGTLRQHDLRDCVSCPANGATDDDCRNILVRKVLQQIFYMEVEEMKLMGILYIAEDFWLCMQISLQVLM